MRTLTILTASLGLSAACFGQDTATRIKKVPIDYTSPNSGPEMFRAYCAPCHGQDGKGTGPAASALKKAPADLTLLSQKHGGKFPAIEVLNTIKGDNIPASHGSRDMPVWGELLRSVSPGQSSVEIRVHVLADYIRSMQQK